MLPSFTEFYRVFLLIVIVLIVFFSFDRAADDGQSPKSKKTGSLAPLQML